jgi:DNA-directed RNA polymerase specialized sigma24 family protein
MSGIHNVDNLSVKRHELFMELYKEAFPVVARYISNKGGSFDEAKDVFQDALVIYYEKTTVAAFNNDTAYLVGIAKHLWLKRYKENDRHNPLNDLDFTVDENEPHPSDERLMHFLATAGKKCMELLRGFYYDKLPLTDLAGLFGYSGVRSVTVQKYKCLEKVRETIKQKALTYEDFME